MKYMILIYQGAALAAMETMSKEEQDQVAAGYAALQETPGFTPGEWMAPPDSATTVRVEDGRTLVTDGPFAETKEAIGGYCFYETDDLDAAIELAARIPAARLGGSIEVRPMVTSW